MKCEQSIMTNPAIVIRQALRDEMSWINDRYDEINFKHSQFDRELIAIAEVNGEKVGLGRLVTIDDRTLELGDMYVLEACRGYGIADKIIEFLLQQVNNHQRVFCIPFISLQALYRKYGFVQVSQHECIPAVLSEKYHWCNQTYEQKILMLVLEKISSL